MVARVAEAGADQRSGYHIAEEVQAQYNPRNRHAEGAEEQAAHQGGLKHADRDSEGESANRVAGRKRKLIGRQERGPRMEDCLARCTSESSLCDPDTGVGGWPRLYSMDGRLSAAPLH